MATKLFSYLQTSTGVVREAVPIEFELQRARDLIDDILSEVIVINPRLRQTETAFAEGRLNEAPRRVEQQGVRDHREGQLLLTKIVDALVERHREHLRAGRLQQANADCEETLIVRKR